MGWFSWKQQLLSRDSSTIKLSYYMSGSVYPCDPQNAIDIVKSFPHFLYSYVYPHAPCVLPPVVSHHTLKRFKRLHTPSIHCVLLFIGLCKLAEGPEPCAVVVQQPDTNNTNDAEATEERGALGNAEVAIERVGKYDTAAGKSATEEVVCSKQTGSILRVAEGDVDEDALHDNEDSGTVDGDADSGHDPVDGCTGCPGEEEEADGGTKGGRESWDEPVLLHREAETTDAWVHVEVQVGDVHGHTDDARNQDAEEDKTDLAHVHVVVNWVDKREDLKD